MEFHIAFQVKVRIVEKEGFMQLLSCSTQRLEQRKRLEEDLRSRIEQLEKRQTQSDDVLTVINRYWNQFNEDIRLMLQRFDAETADESETRSELIFAFSLDSYINTKYLCVVVLSLAVLRMQCRVLTSRKIWCLNCSFSLHIYLWDHKLSKEYLSINFFFLFSLFPFLYFFFSLPEKCIHM